MNKRNILILIALLAIGLLGAQAKLKYKAMAFDNPGTKRVLKTETDSYFYFRSLPEKSMILNTNGVTKLELRSFSTEPLRKPEVVTVIGKNRQTYTLKQSTVVKAYIVYEPITIEIPKDTKSIEVLCYNRSTYLRAFQIIPPKAPKATKLKNLVIKAHGGVVSLLHNGSSSQYYSLMPAQSFKFSLNNKRNAVVYVRPRLIDRTTPKLGLYKDGALVQTIDFTKKRTTKYRVQGIQNLGISIKITLPANSGSSDFELRAISDHLFIAKPVIIKQ